MIEEGALNKKKTYSKEHAEVIIKGETERILRNIGLTAEDLRNKKIVDIGAGERLLAAYCLKNNISKEAYSVDPKIGKYPYDRKFLENNFPDIEKDVRNKTIIAKKKDLPFANDSFDLAVLHGVFMPHELSSEDYLSEEKARVEKIVGEVTRILRKGGEARIWPFYREEKKYEIWNRILLDILGELDSQCICGTFFEYAPLYSGGKEIPAERIILRKL